METALAVATETFRRCLHNCVAEDLRLVRPVLRANLRRHVHECWDAVYHRCYPHAQQELAMLATLIEDGERAYTDPQLHLQLHLQALSELAVLKGEAIAEVWEGP